MKRIDSDALGVVTAALGITGRGSQITEFLDGQLDQTIDTGPLIRRGRTLAATTGLFSPVMRNIHLVADSADNTVNPYEVGTVGVIAPYPAIVPPQFDVWILGASVRRVSGSGTISAVLSMHFASQGWGLDDGGLAIEQLHDQPLAFWDAFATEGIIFGIRAVDRGPFASLGIRLPRSTDTSLQFRTTSSAALVVDCVLQLGLFPLALGQDGLV